MFSFKDTDYYNTSSLYKFASIVCKAYKSIEYTNWKQYIRKFKIIVIYKLAKNVNKTVNLRGKIHFTTISLFRQLCY